MLARIFAAFSLFLIMSAWAQGQENHQADEPNGARIDFNRQIRPIFNEHCTACHGGVKQAADLSFIYRQQVLDSGVIVPGEPDASELIFRVMADDPDTRMPPPEDDSEGLSQQQIELLRRWIASGAPWGEHWSLQQPIDRIEQAWQSSDWPRQTLDHFVLRRLREENLQPSAEAAPAEWLRRVCFDLTGLPPTIQQLDTFQKALAQTTSVQGREAIYRGVVDELLASPHYGERWAAMWMDLARYADTMGFEKDPHREMWPYRDWLIQAFNDDMPFDAFTKKQLAGDLLDNPTIDDLIATAFHRNTQTNTEGGTDDEEFRTAAVIDRINTTWTVWQATTFGCVQCHSHPYDAFRHEEYYRFMAFFNNTEDSDLDNDFPTIQIPSSSEDRSELANLRSRRDELRAAINDPGRRQAEQTSWQTLTPHRVESTHGQLAIKDHEIQVAGGTFPPGCRYTVETDAVDCTAIRIQILPESDDPTEWPEVGSVLSHLQLERVTANGSAHPLGFSQVYVDHLAGPYDPVESLEENRRGFGGYPKLFGPRWAVFVLEEPTQTQTDDQFRFTLLQSATTTGNRACHIRRFRIDYDDHAQWTQLNQDTALSTLRDELDEVKRQIQSLSGARLPIMQSRDTRARRPTRLFIRGNFLDRGDEMQPGVPGVLPRIDEPRPTRLELAQWLTSEANPLTARVLTNRLWAALYGTGLVETLENFGSTGTPPSHSDLLDHLALRLQHDHRWRWKPFLKELVLSATYRQSHRLTPKLRELDPRNRLLARGPRTRLTAEMIRDQALAVSGLLTPAIGGPSVMPPQPEGVWQTVYNNAQWESAAGPNRYRRGLYTYWRRTSPYPSFVMFDAPSREVCSARRVTTNTPLQALVTLNDPVYVECSRALAKRARRMTDGTPEQSIRWAYRAVTQQQLTPDASQQLLRLFQDTLSQIQSSDAEATTTTTTTSTEATEVTESAESSQNTATTKFNPTSLEALTIVTNTLLNLDLALTK